MVQRTLRSGRRVQRGPEGHRHVRAGRLRFRPCAGRRASTRSVAAGDPRRVLSHVRHQGGRRDHLQSPLVRRRARRGPGNVGFRRRQPGGETQSDGNPESRARDGYAITTHRYRARAITSSASSGPTIAARRHIGHVHVRVSAAPTDPRTSGPTRDVEKLGRTPEACVAGGGRARTGHPAQQARLVCETPEAGPLWCRFA